MSFSMCVCVTQLWTSNWNDETEFDSFEAAYKEMTESSKWQMANVSVVEVQNNLQKGTRLLLHVESN